MIVIFSGYNQRAVIAFLRTLKKNNFTSYCIIASGKSDTILNTSYRNKVIYIRKIRELDLKEILGALELAARTTEESKMWITPSTEALNRFLLRHRDIFEKKGCVIPLPDQKIYGQISDKAKFYDLCKEAGIAVPGKKGMAKETDRFTVPLVAKPKKYIASDGNAYAPVFLLTEQEYHTFLLKYRIVDFDLYEFLNGGISFYLLFYFSKSGDVFCYSQKNLVQQQGGKSIVAACGADFHKKQEIVEPYRNLFHKLGFQGLVMVEIRLIQNTYYMIEANPRFWGTSQLFCDIGYNFFELLLKDYGLLTQAEISYINTGRVYFWSGGVQGSLFDCKGFWNEQCFWHKDGKQVVKERYEDFLKADVYKRDDTMGIYDVEQLESLYMQAGRHAYYQVLPRLLEGILHGENIKTKSRWERERLTYMKRHIDFSGKRVLDIGGNTGYFTFELLEEGAEHVDYYEGNRAHAEFVRTAAKVLKKEDKLSVFAEYFLFQEKRKTYDIILCLNVIHHLGMDFFSAQSKADAREQMLVHINYLADVSEYLVFQMGFNWKGNPEDGLFAYGTKAEMEQFLLEGIKKYWDILFIGIAQKERDTVIYQEVDRYNNERQDMLGEFLNRPMFIMKSKVFRG
ncbi:MAG: methyltransferase domain-containing protein [Eubacterium sp.]|nr:methyltransferase domain-containing protein [Eubacterium sp.]